MAQLDVFMSTTWGAPNRFASKDVQNFSNGLEGPLAHQVATDSGLETSNHLISDPRNQETMVGEKYEKSTPKANHVSRFGRYHIVIHGSLNVPIEHHPTIRYMVY